MNKRISLHIWSALLVAIIALMLSSCGVIVSTITPIQLSPTAVLPYIHYTPPEGSNIRLEFDYPSSWVFREDMRDTDFMVLSLGDPRFLTLPTPVDTHPTPNDFGSVVIWIVPSKPGQTSDTQVELLKQGYNEESHIILLKDYKITIDGYDASVLEYQTDDPESSPSLMFNRRIFFIVKDQMYEIHFTVAEKDRGGEFEKGYEYFFNSLEIVL